MLKEDRIDLFFLGDFNEIEVLENIWQHCMEQICQLMLIEGDKVT